MRRFILGIGEVGRAANSRRVSPHKYIIGIDEVGRGCLAGPVTVAAVALPQRFDVRRSKIGIKLRDSKKLTAEQREKWFKWIKQQRANGKSKIVYAIAHARPKTIDRINISQAANLAATRAFKRVCELMSCGQRPRVNELKEVRVYLDGGLYLNRARNSPIPRSPKGDRDPGLNGLGTHQLKNCRTVIKGDEKFNCIKLASIVAKVSRDRLMKRNHKKYPQYGFDEHKGYGTRVHIAAIKKRGFCELHRQSFLRNFA